MKGKYAEEYRSLKTSGHQSLKSDEISFGCLKTKHSLPSKLDKATAQ